MAADLYLSLVIVWSLSVATYNVVRRQTAYLDSVQRTWAAVCVMVAGAVYVVFIRDHVMLATLLPFSGLVVFSNWFPVLCAAMAAVSWQPKMTSRLRRFLPVVALSCLGIFASVQPFTGQAPRCSDTWDNDICLQSSWYSCSAACAATLLKLYEIDATETELTKLCLTRKGTTWQGLFRGLTLKTQATDWKVAVDNPSVEELHLREALPAIISVGIPTGANVDPIYEQLYGWPPGQMHSVVLLSIHSDGRPEIADPSIGREFWSPDDLRVLYRGTALRLVAR